MIMENKRKVASVREAVILLCVFSVAVLLIAFYLRKDGQYIIVEKSGENIHKFKITDEQEISVQGESGILVVIKIHNGEVQVVSSDCPDKTCVKTGKISKAGEMIVCLPARISVKIEGKGSADALTG